MPGERIHTRRTSLAGQIRRARPLDQGGTGWSCSATEDPRVRGLVVGAVALAIDCGFPLCGHDLDEETSALTEAISLDFPQARKNARAVLFPPGTGC